ncbi:MAG: ParB/RepB/Spo0J family partition protein [Acidobacteria bacterium]|nr:ParB/RepB/Spo0J family partition protein [Acidobacteriota bacterium]
MKKEPNALSQKRKALGRGLDALLATKKPAPAAAPGPSPIEVDPSVETIRQLSLALIDANPDQPRQTFSAESIAELAQSIRIDGVIQPLIVRPAGDRYLLIAGERRMRAAQAAGLMEVPAVVRDIADDRVLEIALIENIQREDLNSIEVAQALQRMAHELSLSHEELAQRTGKNRTTITNLLRLLKLPASVQRLVAQGQLQMGHARALLALSEETDQVEVADEVLRRGLSVRQVEELVRKRLQPVPEPEPKPVDPNVEAAVETLERALGTRVRLIQRGRQSGKIEIEYSSQDELDRIYAHLTGDES